MVCSGLLHNPRVPRSSALLLAASKYHQALRMAHVRGCRDPQLPKGYAPGTPQEGRDFPASIGGFLELSQPPIRGWAQVLTAQTEGMASGVVFPWSLGVCRGPGNFFRFSVLRRSGLKCPVTSHKVLHLPALCSHGKTNRQKLPSSN